MTQDDEQAKLWNGSSGRAWVEAQPMLDAMFAPFADLLADAVSARGATHVLDVGCGAGATTFAAARRVGAAGSCVGVDISAPLIEAAERSAAQTESATRFILADAQSYAFAPPRFDLIISRFGVMFFADPVAAFANLRRAARVGGELCLAVWRSPAENPFMTAAERAAAPLLPELPPRQPGAPGQFAFADAARVEAILREGGWDEIALAPIDVACAFPAVDLTRYLTRLGPLGQHLSSADEATRARILAAIQPAFEPYLDGPQVRFTAACWLVSARSNG